MAYFPCNNNNSEHKRRIERIISTSDRQAYVRGGIVVENDGYNYLTIGEMSKNLSSMVVGGHANKDYTWAATDGIAINRAGTTDISGLKSYSYLMIRHTFFISADTSYRGFAEIEFYCFLQDPFGKSCKVKMDKLACPKGTKLQGSPARKVPV